METGQNVYIENLENRFAARNTWRADGVRQLGQWDYTPARESNHCIQWRTVEARRP